MYYWLFGLKFIVSSLSTVPGRDVLNVFLKAHRIAGKAELTGNSQALGDPLTKWSSVTDPRTSLPLSPNLPTQWMYVPSITAIISKSVSPINSCQHLGYLAARKAKWRFYLFKVHLLFVLNFTLVRFIKAKNAEIVLYGDFWSAKNLMHFLKRIKSINQTS